MSDSLSVMKANFGDPEYRVMFGEIKCTKHDFVSSSQIQQFGRALYNSNKLILEEWFLTKEKNGKRFLTCGNIDRSVRAAVISIDVDKNINILSSALFRQRIKHGHGFEVVIEGMDTITPEDRARGGFWAVFSPVE